MIEIAMTPEQFAKAKAALANLPGEVKSFTQSTPTSGTLVTAQVSLNYGYDGSMLQLAVTERRGFAELASDDRIRRHIVALLARV